MKVIVGHSACHAGPVCLCCVCAFVGVLCTCVDRATSVWVFMCACEWLGGWEVDGVGVPVHCVGIDQTQECALGLVDMSVKRVCLGGCADALQSPFWPVPSQPRSLLPSLPSGQAGSQLPQSLTVHAPHFQGPKRLPAQLIALSCSCYKSEPSRQPRDHRDKGGREEATPSPLGLSLGEPKGSRFLSVCSIWATQGDLSGDTLGFSRHELEHFQRWNAFRYKTWYFWRLDKHISRDKVDSISSRGAFLKVK